MTGSVGSLAGEARAEAERLLRLVAGTETSRDTPALIARAQVWATLSVSYELAARP